MDILYVHRSRNVKRSNCGCERENNHAEGLLRFNMSARRHNSKIHTKILTVNVVHDQSQTFRQEKWLLIDRGKINISYGSPRQIGDIPEQGLISLLQTNINYYWLWTFNAVSARYTGMNPRNRLLLYCRLRHCNSHHFMNNTSHHAITLCTYVYSCQ